MVTTDVDTPIFVTHYITMCTIYNLIDVHISKLDPQSFVLFQISLIVQVFFLKLFYSLRVADTVSGVQKKQTLRDREYTFCEKIFGVLVRYLQIQKVNSMHE